MSTFFIIESGYKTSYISNLLVSMFYANKIDYKVNPTNSDEIYLYQNIKTLFIDKIRKGQTIFREHMNRIRNLLFFNGWANRDELELFCKEYDVGDLYIFITKFLGITPIQIMINQYDQKQLAFMSVNPTNEKIINIDDYLYTNYCKNILNITEIPHLITIKINRNYMPENKTNRTRIDIKKKIVFFPHIHEYKYLTWDFYSCICFDRTKYYSIINSQYDYYLFDETNIPCLEKIELNKKNAVLIKKIMEECVLVMYTIDI